MRLLDRYLLRELLIPFGYCLSGFVVFWIAFDLFNELDTFQSARLTGLEIARYYLIKTPEFLVFPMLPIAWLLALLYALTNHGRHHELTAIRAAGISVWRIALPYLTVGLLLSLGVLALNELWAPQSSDRAEALLRSHEVNPSKDRTKEWEKRVGFTHENRTWLIEAYNLTTGEMVNPHVEWIQEDGTRVTLFAERGIWTNGNWVLTNVQELVYPPTRGGVPTPSQQETRVLTGFTETPELITREIRIGEIETDNLRQIRRAQLSIREIYEYLQSHPETSKPNGKGAAKSSRQAMLETKLHGRLAAPWTCLVIVLIALPFGMASGRRNVFVGVASSIVICFGYFVLTNLALALGVGRYVPPWAAAWAPNVFFTLAGLGLTWRVR